MNFSARETLMALANNRLHMMDAARSLYLSRNALVHRVEVIHDATGLNPLDFWDLQELLKIYEEEK